MAIGSDIVRTYYWICFLTGCFKIGFILTFYLLFDTAFVTASWLAMVAISPLITVPLVRFHKMGQTETEAWPVTLRAMGLFLLGIMLGGTVLVHTAFPMMVSLTGGTPWFNWMGPMMLVPMLAILWWFDRRLSMQIHQARS